MRLGVYQNNPQFGEVGKNVEQALRDLKGIGADLIVLPELFSTGYQFISKEEVEPLAEEIPEGKTSKAFIDFACAAKTFLVFGLAEKEGWSCYNSAAVAGPEGFIGTYRKAHLFAEEKDLFSPGETGFRVFDSDQQRSES